MSTRRLFDLVPTRLAIAGVLSGVCLGLAGCGGGDINATGPVPTGPTDRVSGTLTVVADPALADVVDQVAAALERQHPKLDVRTSYTADPSGGVDVVASFSRTTLARLERQGAVGRSVVVAQQAPALVVAPGNPGAVGTLADISHRGVTTALCSADTSCGEATASLLRNADVTPSAERRVPDGAAALQAVTDRSTAAAIVWASDVRGRSGADAARRGVRTVAFSADPQRNIRLIGLGSRPVLVATATKGNAAGAVAFTDLLRSGAGQRLLQADGYR